MPFVFSLHSTALKPWSPRPQSEVLVCPVGCGIKQSLRVPPMVLFLGATVASSSFTAKTRTSPCCSPCLCLFYAWALPENAADLFCLSSLATPDHFSKRLYVSPSKFNMRECGLQTQAEPLKVPWPSACAFICYQEWKWTRTMLLGAAGCKSCVSSHVDALRWSICTSLPLATQTALLPLWASRPHLPNTMKAQGPWEQRLFFSLFEYSPMLRGVAGKSSIFDGWISNLPIFSWHRRQWHGGGIRESRAALHSRMS